MKKYILSLLVVVTALLFSHPTIYAKEDSAVKTLPPIIAQASGPGSTIIMWHDIDEDGKPDYKATYTFINGRLQLLEKDTLSKGYPGAIVTSVN